METIILVPARGLGDLMIVSGLIHNLSKQYKIEVYHPLIGRMSHLYPGIVTHERPNDISEMKLDHVSHCVMIYEDSPFFYKLQPQLKEHFKEKQFVLNPVVTAKKDYIFSDDYFFNPKISFSENLLVFAKTHYLQETVSKTSGIKLESKKDPKLVVMHVTASKESKSWFPNRFKFVKSRLEKKGYNVVFATLPHEKAAIERGLYSGLNSLEDLVENVSKASLVIGNESGVCHLASALHTPTLVLCRNPRIQRFWGADYEGKCHPLFPPNWTPNVKNFRIRDKYWRQLIFKRTVVKKALELLEPKV